MPAGRPRKAFNRRIAEEVCARIAFSADGLHKVLDDINAEANPGLERQAWTKIITLHQIWTWLEENKEFSNQYARAREKQAEYLGDLQMAEAHQPRIGEYRKRYREVDSQGRALNEKVEIRQDDNVARSRLVCDVIDRRMKQLAPKKYRESSREGDTGPNEQLEALRQALIDGPVGAEAAPLDEAAEEKKKQHEPGEKKDEPQS